MVVLVFNKDGHEEEARQAYDQWAGTYEKVSCLASKKHSSICPDHAGTALISEAHW